MYYSISINDRTNCEWRALSIKDDHNKYILDALTNDEAMTLSKPITLFLINKQSVPSESKALPFAADVSERAG